MIESDSVSEVVYECSECGVVRHGMRTVTHCSRDECESEAIEVIAEMMTRRAKWMWDGSLTIGDMIEKTSDKQRELKELEENGWEVHPGHSPVDDDYAYLVRMKNGYEIEYLSENK